jgi:hypothetical protein
MPRLETHLTLQVPPPAPKPVNPSSPPKPVDPSATAKIEMETLFNQRQPKTDRLSFGVDRLLRNSTDSNSKNSFRQNFMDYVSPPNRGLMF